MLTYIIRLDDATPKMNKARWDKVEKLLDKYNIRPIVGIIPDCRDQLFVWEEDATFWTETVSRWQRKKWTIAQHGCHHVYHVCENGVKSEFIGLSYDEQMALIQYGYNELKKHNVEPDCFFAPAHTFDNTTVDVCRDCGFFKFISDGYALYPYLERNMLFLPNVYDTPHKILPFGVYTFVIHPSFITDKSLARLEQFIIDNKKNFVSVPEMLGECALLREKTIPEKWIAPMMRAFRNCRKIIRG